jgi:hypothetical protein
VLYLVGFSSSTVIRMLKSIRYGLNMWHSYWSLEMHRSSSGKLGKRIQLEDADVGEKEYQNGP